MSDLSEFTLTPRAIERLREVVIAIGQNPDLFSQHDSAVPEDCDTPGCIAGWLVKLFYEEPQVSSCHIYTLGRMAAEILDLPHSRAESVDEIAYRSPGGWRGLVLSQVEPMDLLFYTEFWPRDLDEAYNSTLDKHGDIEDRDKAVSTAAERIEHFIEHWQAERDEIIRLMS